MQNGDKFKTLDRMKYKMEDYALLHKKPLRVKVSLPRFVKWGCLKGSLCDFVASASYKAKRRRWLMNRFVAHSCQMVSAVASSKWVAETYKGIIRVDKKIRPNVLVRRARADKGVIVTPYSARKAINMVHCPPSEADNYEKISSLLRELSTSDAGTITDLKIDAQGRFQRLFVYPSAASEGLRSALPVIALDACHLTGPFKGMKHFPSYSCSIGVLLAATGLDGAGQIVPLAFCIAETESEETWTYCLTHLLRGSPWLNAPSILILSDREKGLSNAVEALLPCACHTFCAFHIAKNVNPSLTKGSRKLFFQMARAQNVETFEELLAKLRESQPRAAEYIEQIPLETWVACYCPLPRFGHITSNIAESFNRWILEERGLDHFSLVVSLLERMSNLYRTRKDEYRAARGILPLKVQRNLDSNIQKAHRYVSRETVNGIYRVKKADVDNVVYIVNLLNKSCTCGKFVDRQFPCAHACSSILGTRKNPIDLMSPRYKTISLRAVYDGNILPICVQDLPTDDLLPPLLRKRRGRPAKSRMRRSSEKKRYECGFCHRMGHNKRRCPERLELARDVPSSILSRETASSPRASALPLFEQGTRQSRRIVERNQQLAAN